MRTVVVSDLHAGARGRPPVLTLPVVRERLVEAVADADRLVLLGDLFELRERPLDDVLAERRELFRAIGGALADGAEVVLTPGNHDHELSRAVFEQVGGVDGLTALEHAVRVRPAEPLGPLARALGRPLVLSYPGVWLREDVYAIHGHYMDHHSSVPTFECLALAAVTRANGGAPPAGCTPAHYERIAAPVMRAAQAVGTAARSTGRGGGADVSIRLWERLAGAGDDQPAAGLAVRALAAAVPAAVDVVNRAGLGPFQADFSAPALRQSGLRSIGEAMRRLGVDARHVVFGHTHRAGPLPADAAEEWRTPGGAQLHNPGSWVYEPAFAAAGPRESPYWPGGVIELDDDGPPRMRRMLDDVDLAALTATAAERPDEDALPGDERADGLPPG